jgi:NAD(P)-dependent dehydrogenase (short-subunit alcohol dehydrogenase family)
MAKGSYHVLMGSRSLDRGNAAVKELRSRNLPGSVEAVELDVTKDDTIERAATTVERDHGKLDMLVNNAGIGSMTPPLRQQMRDAFDTNATGPAVVTIAFAPLLQKSTASPRIVNISSGVGSLNRRLDPSSPTYKMQQVQYRASKAALSMVTACQWVEYGPAVKVFAYDPGFTQSNLGPHNKAENGAKPASEAVMPLIDVLEGKRDDEAGKFLHNTGVYPW